jgi:hypothetical protein
LAEQGYNVKAFAIKILQEEHTLLQLREVLTQLKIIKMMVTLSTDCSMIPLKVVTTEQEKLTFTDWLKFLLILLTMCSSRVPLVENTEVS